MAQGKIVVDHEFDGTKKVTADDGAFEPSVWGDFFVTYAPPVSQRSEEWMKERVDKLREEVRQMFKAGESISADDDMVILVDTLERLGIDNHFRKEINEVLSRVHNKGALEFGNDLHVVALQFRLLRQHGFWVSTDVFEKFRDNTGSFDASLRRDPRGLLSLYNAAHLAIPGEKTLDEAISFSRRCLESMKGRLRSPMAEQVSRSLDIPLPRFPKRLETMHYIVEYEKEDAHSHSSTLLELARLDFELLRSLHLKELKALSLWWRELYDTVKLSYARDRLVESYFLICCVYHEEEFSRARMMLAKPFGLLSLMDDTYDLHATIEECRTLNEAIQRWDENAVTILPEYLRTFYLKLLRSFDELENSLEPHERYRMSYSKIAYKLQSEYYLAEAEWLHGAREPTFKEHMEVSVMSSACPMLSVQILLGAPGAMATEEAFEWASAVPDMVTRSGEIGRFLNDIAAYKGGKRKKDMVSSVECYEKEHGTTGEAAVEAVAAMAEHAWRSINRTCMEMDRSSSLLAVAQLLVNFTRTFEVLYLGGRDAYTFGSNLKDTINSLFLKPVPI